MTPLKLLMKRALFALGKNFNSSILEKDSIALFKEMSMKKSVETFFDDMMRTVVVDDRTKLQDIALSHCETSPIVQGGLFLEFGVYTGNSINRIARRLKDNNTMIYGFDAFRGIEEDWKVNALKGKLNLNGRPPIVESNVELIVGWVQDTLPAFLEKNTQPFQFVHLDMDTYMPTAFVLGCIRNRLRENSIVLFDELHGYDKWQVHEYKALNDNMRPHEYEFLGFGPTQAIIRVVRDLD